MSDIIGIVLIFLFVIIVISLMIMEELPRGLRWLWPLTQTIGRALSWLFLRVFYPERLPKNDPKPLAPNELTLKHLEALDEAYRAGATVWHDEYEMWCKPGPYDPGPYDMACINGNCNCAPGGYRPGVTYDAP